MIYFIRCSQELVVTELVENGANYTHYSKRIVTLAINNQRYDASAPSAICTDPWSSSEESSLHAS